MKYLCSDFIWDFGKLPFPTHLGKYFIKIGKIRAKIHEIGKIKAIFGLGMTPIYGLINGQIKSLLCIDIFKVKFNLSLIICACNKIVCENTPLDFHCVEEKVFLIKIISMIFC